MAKKREVTEISRRAGSSILAKISLLRDEVKAWDEFPFSLPCIQTLHRIEISQPVCFFVGENGSGKSTLLEAIAAAYGFGPQGGSKHASAVGARDEATEALAGVLRLSWRQKPLDGYFLRTESFFNIATYIDEIEVQHAYGGTSLHEQSHGESFLALFQHRFSDNGFYVLDEPEAALSPQRQLTLLAVLHQRVAQSAGIQFIIATHSPILLAYPAAQILSFDDAPLREVTYQQTGSYEIMSGFLQNPDLYLRHLLE